MSLLELSERLDTSEIDEQLLDDTAGLALDSDADDSLLGLADDSDNELAEDAVTELTSDEILDVLWLLSDTLLNDRVEGLLPDKLDDELTPTELDVEHELLDAATVLLLDDDRVDELDDDEVDAELNVLCELRDVDDVVHPTDELLDDAVHTSLDELKDRLDVLLDELDTVLDDVKDETESELDVELLDAVDPLCVLQELLTSDAVSELLRLDCDIELTERELALDSDCVDEDELLVTSLNVEALLRLKLDTDEMDCVLGD